MVSSSSRGEKVGRLPAPRAELILQPQLTPYIHNGGYRDSWKNPGKGLGQAPDCGIYISGALLEHSGRYESHDWGSPLPESSKWPTENL